jgi:hypothetical protein
MITIWIVLIILPIILVPYVIILLKTKKTLIEKEHMLDRARVLLIDAERSSKVQLVKYTHFSTNSEEFLKGMQPFFDNKYVLSWLQQHKSECNDFAVQSLASDNKEKAFMFIAQIAMIDSMLADLRRFQTAFESTLKEKHSK